MFNSMLKKEPLYSKWHSMRTRCENPKSSYYYRYGGRGIKVCKRWKLYSNFESDLLVSYIEHLKIHGALNTTLDRIDNNKGYFPENCHWATQKEQCKNRKAPRETLVTIGGITRNLKDWASIYGIKYSTVTNRIRLYKWEATKAITTSARPLRG